MEQYAPKKRNENISYNSFLEEFDDMGSFNHSTVQANLAYLLKRTGKYTVSVELSLDSSSLNKDQFNVKDEVIPDVCIYPKRRLAQPRDILKMAEMPLMIITRLSETAFWIDTHIGNHFILDIKFIFVERTAV